MRSRRSMHKLTVHFGQWSAIHTNLDESRTNTRTIYAVVLFSKPSPGEGIRIFGKRMFRQELAGTRPVRSGVGQQLNTTGFGRPPEQPWIAAKPGGRALGKGLASQFTNSLQMGQNNFKCVICRIVDG